MKKRIIVALLVTILLLGGCNTTPSQSPTPTPSTEGSSPATSGEEIEELTPLTISIARGIKAGGVGFPTTFFDGICKEKYNINLEWVEYDEANQDEVLPLLFASDEFPELFYRLNWNNNVNINKYGDNGYFRTVKELWDQMPNYRSLWSGAEWDTNVTFSASPKGNNYYLFLRNTRTASMCWIYNESALEKTGMSFPTTTDELFDVAKAYYDLDPERNIPISNRGNGLFWQGLLHTYRIDPGNGWYADIDNNDKVTYAPTQQKWRDAVAFYSKLYANKLMDQEFQTISNEQFYELVSSDRILMTYDWGTRKDKANAYLLEAGKEESAKWTWTDTLIDRSDSDKPSLAQVEMSGWWYGPAFTTKINDEKMERFAMLVDYASTKEGMWLFEAGVEGESYTFDADGNMVLEPEIKTVSNPDGKYTLGEKYNILGYIVTNSPEYLKATGGDLVLDISKAYAPKPSLNFLMLGVTDSQQSEIADAVTALNTLRDEFMYKCIYGTLDITDDSVWEDFQKELKKAGLDPVQEMYDNTATVLKSK